MNRKLLALAVTAALALPLAAQAAPTVYGLLNLSVDMVNLDRDVDSVTPGIQTQDDWEVNSNSSRLGIMGEEALGNGLSAVYKAEWGVAGDTTGAADLRGRDRYLGLKSSFGTVKLGAFDSPLKSSQGMVDQFNDMVYLDMTALGGLVGDNRMNNLIGYESPKLADAITVKLALQPGETNQDKSIAEAFSTSVAYEANGLYAALAYDNQVSSGSFNNTTARDALRLTGTYTMDALQFGALVQTSKLSNGANDDQEQSLLLSAAYTMDKCVFKGEIISSNQEFGASPDDQKTMLIAVGMDHNFTKMTKAYGQVGYAQVDNVGGVNGVDANDSVFSIGMQTKF